MSEALRFELDTAPFEEQLLEAETKLRRFREEEKASSIPVSIPAAGGKQGEQPAVSLAVAGKPETSSNGNAQEEKQEKQENRTAEQTVQLLRELLTYAALNNQLFEQIQEQLKEIAENQEKNLQHEETDEDEIIECVEYL